MNVGIEDVSIIWLIYIYHIISCHSSLKFGSRDRDPLGMPFVIIKIIKFQLDPFSPFIGIVLFLIWIREIEI